MNNNDDYDSCDTLFLRAMVGGAAVLLILVVASLWKETKPQGYGGSPGHMSPMEVEALYKKNHP